MAPGEPFGSVGLVEGGLKGVPLVLSFELSCRPNSMGDYNSTASQNRRSRKLP